MPRLLVLDFDGTMTDAEEEGAPFRAGYLGDIAALTGLPLKKVQELAHGFEAEVAAKPGAYGWVYDGHIVAPATVDPYLRIMPVARKIFDHVDAFENERDRTRLLDAILYKYNYAKTTIAFRDNAREVLLALGRDPDVETYIVTNSHTQAVKDKVAALGRDGDLDWLVHRVYGRAQKYVIDDNFLAVPHDLKLPGLKRPVLLRRKLYHDVLAGLLAEHSLKWKDLVVVGDIFELDLCLPWSKGARVGLVANEHTPAYEVDFLEKSDRGAVLNSLSQIAGFVKG